MTKRSFYDILENEVSYDNHEYLQHYNNRLQERK